MKFFGYLVVLSLFAIPLLLYRKWYPVRLSYVHVYAAPGGKTAHELGTSSPSGRWLRSVFFDKKIGRVRLGSGYVAIYSMPDRLDPDFSSFFHYRNEFWIPSDFYIFKISRFGRLQAVDLSSRSLTDVISNIS